MDDIPGHADYVLRQPIADTIINNAQSDFDFRFATVGQANAVFIQGSDGFMGLNTDSPATQLDVNGVGRFGNFANTIQVIVRANVSQSNDNPLIQFQESDGTALMGIHSDDVSNVFIGLNAGQANAVGVGSVGQHNTFVGSGTGYSNTTGGDNTAIGYNALYSNIGAYYNLAVGVQALYSNTTGGWNSAIGANTLYTNISGNYNMGAGHQVLAFNTSGDFNIGLGYEALFNNTTADYNSAIGTNTLHANLTGHDNTAIGTNALLSNLHGDYNIAIGTSALRMNINHYNLALGYAALYSNVGGSYNSALGTNALKLNTSGTNNLAMGTNTLSQNTSGHYNVGIGGEANRYNQTGSNNTIIGHNAGRGTTLHNKSGNIFIGYQAGYNETGSNKLYIANTNTATPLISGDFSATTLSFQAAVTINEAGNDLDFRIKGVGQANAFFVQGSDGAVGVGTGTPTLGKIEIVGNIAIGGSNNELRFYEGVNYVGFEAPALAADQIWVLPDSDGTANQVMETDGSGNLSWADVASFDLTSNFLLMGA